MQRIKIGAASFGFASFLATNAFSLWGIKDLPQLVFGIENAQLWSLPLLISNLFGFLVFVIGSKLKPRLFCIPPYLSSLCFLGGGTLFLLGFMTTKLILFLLCAAILIGLGTTCCFLCWEILLARFSDIQTKQCLIFATLLSIPLTGTLILLPASFVPIAITCFALVNIALLAVCLSFQEKKPFLSRSFLHESIYRPSDQFPAIPSHIKPLTCIILIGSVSPLLDSFALTSSLINIDKSWLIILSNGVAALILAFSWRFLTDSISLSQAFTAIFPFLITTVVLYPLLQESYRSVIVFFNTLGFTLFSIVMMVYCAKQARSHNANIVYLYAFFAGVTYASQLFAWVVAAISAYIFPNWELRLYLNVGILVAACTITIVILLKTERKRRSEQTKQAQDKITSRCNELQDEYRLSQRQLEIVTLLAHGYDTPTIARKLFISENTVRTHIKKVYLLMDIHSRQELIEQINQPISFSS